MNNQHQQSGHLYYIKLKTDLGIFYKIGFTTYQNINDRFNYDGSNDYKLIQETLMFQYYNDAYYREQTLHRKYSDKKAFYKYSNASYLPFANNGQSELYYDDILSLDKNFSKTERFFTKLKVYLAIFKSNPIKIILSIGFAIAVFIGMFPYSLIFILIIYMATKPPEQTYNISGKTWDKIISKISKKSN